MQEINTAVTSMDDMTQQNSALVEESSAAARAMSDQAGKLTELMSFFKSDKKASKQRPSHVKASSPPKANPARPAPTLDAKVAMATDGDGWGEF